jgi:hypothetical protein
MADIVPGAEFQALPLEFVLAAPLSGAVKAQAVVAASIKGFIDAYKGDTVTFAVNSNTQGSASSSMNVTVPLLAIVPIPNLRIDSLTVDFKYEISQVIDSKQDSEKGISLNASSTGLLAKFVDFGIKGSVTSRSSTESTVNRSGHLEITLHASEGPTPEGLARILSLLAHSVPLPQPTGATGPAGG